MSVVLSILKIIGIILLVILCIILALLLIVLFVPIRYNAHVVKEERGPDGKITEGLAATAGVSWLAHIVSFGISFKEGKLSKGLKIFGIDLSKRKKQKEKKKKKKTAKEGTPRALSEIAEEGKKKKDKEKAESASKDLLTAEVPSEEGEKAGNAPESAEETGTEASIGGNEEAGTGEAGTGEDAADTETEEAADTETPDEEENPGKDSVKKKKRKTKEEKAAEKAAKAEKKAAKAAEKAEKAAIAAENKKRAHRKKADTFTEFLWRIAEAVYNVFRKIAEKIRGVVEKLKGIFAVIEKWTDFLEDDRTQEAVALALREVGGILKGLLPKKVKGYVRFGHDDPAKTGQQLAYLAAAYPLYGRNLDIYPDFEQKALEGDVELKGRVFLATIVWAGLKLILNKNIKYVIGFVRNKEDKANGGE